MTLSRLTVHLVSGDSMSPETFSSVMFCRSRLEKIESHKTLNGKIQNACAELAVIAAVEKRFGASPPVEYEYAENGKPRLKDPSLGYISISHAGLAGACAIFDYPIGIDIERQDRDVSRIINKLLSPNEAGAECPRPLDIWCAKESYVKMTGEGLSRPFAELNARGGAITDMQNRRLAYYQIETVGEYTVCACSVAPFTLEVILTRAR